MSSNNINNYSPWIRFDNIEWNGYNLNSYLESFEENEFIYHQQQYTDYVYLVKDGRVRICIYSKEGDEQHLTIAEKGSIFGELSAIDGLPNFGTAISITNSEIYKIPKNVFLKVIFSNTEVQMKMLQSLVRKIRVLSAIIKNLSFKDSYSRVVIYLINLANSHGTFSDKRCRLNIKFTHQEMANLTCLSRVTVSYIMSDLMSKGLIRKSGGYLVIEDIDRLNDLM